MFWYLGNIFFADAFKNKNKEILGIKCHVWFNHTNKSDVILTTRFNNLTITAGSCMCKYQIRSPPPLSSFHAMRNVILLNLRYRNISGNQSAFFQCMILKYNNLLLTHYSSDARKKFLTVEQLNNDLSFLFLTGKAKWTI